MVTIIIPVYNSSKHLSQCLNSVLSQSYHNIQVIIINDGSTDNSGLLCDEFANRDARVMVFHKGNGGVSSARNLGLKHAVGEYVCFIDSDDFVTKKFILDLEFLIKSHATDIIIQSISKFYKNYTEKKSYDISSQYLNINDFLSRFNVTTFGYVAGKIYKNDIIKSNKLKFDENLDFGEDCKFLINYLCFSENIFLSDQSNYFYRIGEPSLSTDSLQFVKEYLNFTKMNEALNELYQKKNLTEDTKLIHYTQRLIHSVFQDETLVNYSLRIEKIKFLLSNHPTEIFKVYKKSKIRGKLFYFLLKYRQFFLFDFAFRKFR